MKLFYLFILSLTFVFAGFTQAASPDIVPGAPGIPSPPQISSTEVINASSTKKNVSINTIEEKTKALKDLVVSNESINFSQEVYQDYHKSLLKSVNNLIDYAPDYTEWTERIFTDLKYLLESEQEIYPLVQKIKGTKGIKRFLFGLDKQDTTKFDIKVNNALKKVNDLQWIQERQKRQEDWARLGQEVYDLRSNIEAISDDMKKEKEQFSIWGWIADLFV